MLSPESEVKMDEMTEALMPAVGGADTFEGEIIRAYHRVGYRYLNDGDYPTEGYGVETSGPALCFLLEESGVLYPKIRAAASKLVSTNDFEANCVALGETIVEQFYSNFKANKFLKVENGEFDFFRYRKDAEERWGEDECSCCGEKESDCCCCIQCGETEYECTCWDGDNDEN